MENQINFQSSSNCPTFSPNKFKKDLCQICIEKISKHSTATDEQIRDALNYFVDKVPSLIWSGQGNVFMGGYKSAINIKFIQDNSIRLIINASGNFENIMGPKYLSELSKRRLDNMTREIRIDWIDATIQKIKTNELMFCMREINICINEGIDKL
nr:uncharacterized protein LOC121123705 [Lepeophtheirus salmonis]